MFGEPVSRRRSDPPLDLDEDTLDGVAAEPAEWHLLDQAGGLEAETVFGDREFASARPAPRHPAFTAEPGGAQAEPGFGGAEHPQRNPGYGWRRPPSRIRTRSQRSPAAGLAWLVVLGLLAAFFGWFSAEPLWLSLGHGVPGTATVVDCSIHGITGRCADFSPASGAFPVTRVTLLGLGRVATGQQVAARMVSPSGWQAYAGDRSSLYLRWVPGLVVVLLCGLGIAWGTGVSRLPRRRRMFALLASIAGPLLLAAGLFVAAW
jgi:hypothetical protein